MASDDSSGARPAAPIVIRIKLRYDDVEAMVQRFAPNVGKSGLFLPTKAVQPIGAEIKFELRLADDTPALVGLGRVRAATPPASDNPRAVFGMAIELSRVTPQSRALILRMLERRRALGLAEVALPMAADIEAARRADFASGPVPLVAPPPAAAPVVASPPAVEPVVAPPAALSSPGIAVPSEPAGEALMTAPRRTTGRMAAAKVLAIAPLGAEPPRRRRMSMSEVIDSASGPIARMTVATPGLDEDVDVAAVLARARVLAGAGAGQGDPPGDRFDAELAALAEVAAVPVEISIDAASAELARQLGGSAVNRDRSARWAPPPATATPVAAGVLDEAFAAPIVAPPAAAPADEPDEELELDDPVAELLAAQSLTSPEPAPAPAPASEAISASSPEAAPEPALHADPEPAPEPELHATPGPAPASELEALAAPEPAPAGDVHEVEPDQIADVIHQLNELDLEDVEHTEMGEIPLPVVPRDTSGYVVGPDALVDADALPDALADADALPGAVDGIDAMPNELAALMSDLAADEAAAVRLDSQLAAAEAEADADALELAAALGISVEGPSSIRYIEPVDDAAAMRDDEVAEAPHDLSLDEFDDFEILAEADADDEDLLASHGEQETSSHRAVGRRAAAPRSTMLPVDPMPPEPADRPSQQDFALRLDLGEDSLGEGSFGGDESDMYYVESHRGSATHDVFDGAHVDPLLDSAGQALAAFDTSDEPLDDPAESAAQRIVQPIFEPEPSSSFTLAVIPSSDSVDLDLGVGPALPHERAAPRPTRLPPPQREPEVLRGAPQLPSLYGGPVEDDELEHALGALDVDLDDLSIPAAAPAAAPAPRTPVPRRTGPHVVPRKSVGTPSRSQPIAAPAPAPVSPRVTTDDGLEIDFDDDD